MKNLYEIELPSLTAFDRGSNVTEILERAVKDPDWATFFDSDANAQTNGLLSVLYAFDYMFSKNAKAFNRQFRELFYQYAITSDALMSEIAKKGISIRQNNAPCGILTATLLDQNFTDETLSMPISQLTAQASSGGNTTYEIITRNDDGSYDYLNNVMIEPGVTQRDMFKINAYAGVTRSMTVPVTASRLSNFSIDLGASEIIGGSVVVYVSFNGQVYTLPRVSSLNVSTLIHPAFPQGMPHVVVGYTIDGDAKITFGSSSYGGQFDESHIKGGASIMVYWREGGGSSAQCPAGGINEILTFAYGAGSRQINFTNDLPILGGVDRETSDDLKDVIDLKAQRDGTIIDEQDAELAIRGGVVKYAAAKPTISDQKSSIPLLHVFHYAVPKRSFSDFSLPVPNSADTAETYCAKVNTALNEYLNLVGIRDTSTQSRTLSRFFGPDSNSSYSFKGNVPDLNLLSGTLKLLAHDRFGNLLDSITFDKMYTQTSFDTYYAQPVKITSNTVSKVEYQSNGQTTFNVKFFWKGSEAYVVSFPITQDYTLAQFATALNTYIQSVAPNTVIANYKLYTYAYCETDSSNPNFGKLNILSFDSEPLTQIEIVAQNGLAASDHNVYKALGINIGVYTNIEHSTKVFNPGKSSYSPGTSQLMVSINDSNIENQARSFVFKAGEFVQDPGSEKGPIINISIPDLYLKGYPESIQPGTDVLVKAYDSNNSLIGVVDFSKISESEKNTGAVDSMITNQLFSASGHEFDWDQCSLVLPLAEGVEANAYAQSFPVVSRIDISATGQSEQYVDVTMKVIPSGAPDLLFTVDVADAVGHFSSDPNLVFDVDVDRQFIMVVVDSFNKEFTLDLFSVWGGGTADNSVVVSGITPDITKDANGKTIPARVIKILEKQVVTATNVVASFTNVNGAWNQKTSTEDGTVISLPFVMQPDFAYTLQAYCLTGDAIPSLVASASFAAQSSVVSSNAVGISDDPKHPVYSVATSPQYVAADSASRFVITFSDGVKNSNASSYTRGFVEPARIEVLFDRMSYDTITAKYQLDIYNCTGEAATLLQTFKSSNKRLLCVEHMFRNVNFVPVPVDVTLMIDKKYSTSSARVAGAKTLGAFFAYDNPYADNTIGATIGSDYVRTLILKMGDQYGIREINIASDPSVVWKKMTSEQIANSYFFTMPTSIIEAIKAFEELMPNISGASQAYTLTVTANYIS